jgi:exodeoxyribonuclease I
MENTYLFYDIETSGLNKCFDQILQFAAIRTDLELNELEQHNILIKLNLDVIPSPQAILTHNISVEQMQNGIGEYEAIKQIHRLMNHPGTISLGYNSLNFDDEFLRFSFYRNLLPPYTHQYANNCHRMDIYPLTVMYFLYQNKALQWPIMADKPSLKLEDLNTINKLIIGDSHDALIDVKITLELARNFIKYREIWDYLSTYFKKPMELQRIEKLSMAIMVDGIFGANNNYQTVAMSLGGHNHYKNQTLWLQLDSPKLQTTTLDSIPQTSYIVRKKATENYLLLPYSTKFSQYLNAERLGLIADNQKWLQQNPQILHAISTYYKEYKYPIIANIDIDAALYQNGFATDREQTLCAKFHTLPISEKIKLLDKFANTKLLTQAIRLLGRNYPDSLPDNYANKFIADLKSIYSSNEENLPIDYKNQKHFSFKAMLQEIDKLKQSDNLSTKQIELLDNWAKYLASKALNAT